MPEKMVKLYIDNKEVTVPEGSTILDAAKKLDAHIPTLCYFEDLRPTASCGLCIVEVGDYGQTKRACCTPVSEGMKVKTNSLRLRETRKTILEMILSNHNVECPSCAANGKCELQTLANYMEVDMNAFPAIVHDDPIDYSSVSIIKEANKCINCGRCVVVCNEIQTVNAIAFFKRGFETRVNTFLWEGLGNSVCVNCGQCTVVCPTGALVEKSDIEKVWEAILDPDKVVVVQEAPAIRVSLAEEFGMEIGTPTPGKMYAVLRKLGFDYVFDTNFAADLTIIEEGTEAIERFIKGENLPIITSCSPGWIKFMETYFPDFAPNASSAKSPQQIFGVLAKTYFAKEYNIDPAKIVSVSIMPCTAKKYEAQRPEMNASGYRDVDYVLTTREFIKMIKEANIDFKNIPEEEADKLIGTYTGAGTIFGATGGVMEAALRSVYYLLVGKEMDNLDITAVRGMEGIKEAVIDIPSRDYGDIKMKVAVAHGLGNARKLLEKIRKQIKETGKSEYGFVEIMACPGGCVGGGGQPYGSTIAMRARRGEGLYKEDSSLPKRQSHENEMILGENGIYARFFDKPGSPLAKKYLHTLYWERDLTDGKTVRELTKKH